MRCIDVLELSLWAWMDVMLWLTWSRTRSQEKLREFWRDHRMKLWCSCGCVKLGLGTEHCVSLTGETRGRKNSVPAPWLLINAVLFKLHQYLPCSKASQDVAVLFRAQALSQKQFPNSWGRDEWLARAKAGCGGRLCTALSLPCPQLALWAGSQFVTRSFCLCAYALFVFFSWDAHWSLWIRAWTDHKSWNLLPVFESIVLCFMRSVFN